MFPEDEETVTMRQVEPLAEVRTRSVPVAASSTPLGAGIPWKEPPLVEAHCKDAWAVCCKRSSVALVSWTLVAAL
jgi:hypothetical protein